MKRITLAVALLMSLSTFAQKEELKTLKKVYEKEIPSSSDIVKYKEALESLKSLASSDQDKVYYNFFNSMLTLTEFASLGTKVTPLDIQKIFTPENIISFSKGTNEILEYEIKVGKKEFTDEILKDIELAKPIIKTMALDLNNKKKYKESADLFYSLYQLDKKGEGSSLENAAILNLQATDYKAALNQYYELFESDYLNNGEVYSATNKASGKEEVMATKNAMYDFINKLKTHEKPVIEKNSARKPKIAKNIAILLDQQNENEKAKKAYDVAKELDGNDLELLSSEINFYYKIKDIERYTQLTKELIDKNPNDASLHFNLGYLMLKDDIQIVEEINKNLDNYKKYDELVAKRKEMYKRALPHLERSYLIDPNLADLKNILKLSYDILGMKEKADKL
jgi:hypothetical protein